MSNIAIKVENISKLYRLGELGTGTISHDLNRWWSRIRGKEDPYAKVGQFNDRTKKSESDYVWTLKDVNFEVKEGEVLGIIGRNGAGKSTLLKILSKVTAPTAGKIKLKGKVSSLLEVGTGFHPELTGRENIYLNGTILGMTKDEISKRFDEIVDFAAIQRYIDTPVKRYSSGMYVRLAFSVAAFLDTDTLIVDEVLAVGDIEFQKKCLGRMRDISSDHGRTVLFVSHNIPAVKLLCDRGLLLNNGQVSLLGGVDDALKKYFEDSNPIKKLNKNKDYDNRPGLGHVRIVSTYMRNATGEDVESIPQGENLLIEIKYRVTQPDADLGGLHFSVNISDQFGNILIHHTTKIVGLSISPTDLLMNHMIQFKWNKISLTPGKYNISLDIASQSAFVDFYENALTFFVHEGLIYNYRDAPTVGVIGINAEWSF